MYGLVFLAVKDLVLSKFSEKEWAKIVAGAKCPHEFTTDRPYDDQTLYDIVAAAAKVLGMPAEEVVEHAGYWFMVYIRNKTTYGHLLEFMGDNLPDFLNNINRLHTHLLKGAHFPEIKSPRFRVSRRKKDSLVLHYSPGKETRLGLAPLVMGIVKGVAMEILKLERISVQHTKTRERDGADVFQVNWSPPHVPEDERGRLSRGESPRASMAPVHRHEVSPSGSSHSDNSNDEAEMEPFSALLQCPAAALAATGGNTPSPSSASSSDIRRSRPQAIGLPPKGLSRLFPFHIIFDRDCQIQQAGPSLQRIVAMEAGDPMSQYFSIAEPASCSFAAFRPIYLNRKVAPFTIVHDYDDDFQLTLHGEMVWCKAKQVMCFACAPVLASLEEAKYFGIDIADFSLCDQAQARLLTSHAQLMKGAEEPTRKDKKDTDRKQNIFKLLRPPVSPRKKPEKLTKTASFSEKSADGGSSPTSQSNKSVPRLGLVADKAKRGRSASTPSPPRSPPTSARKEKIEEADVDEQPAEEALNVPSPNYHRMLNAFTEMLLEDSWDQYVLVRTLLRLGLSGDDGRAVRQVFDAVMSFYAQMGKVQNLLLVVIFDELSLAAPTLASSTQSGEQGEQGTVLFREDSVGLRMLTTFLNQEGKAYLESLTVPLLQAASSLDAPIELDPARNPSASDREQSAKRVLEMAQAFLVHAMANLFFLRFLSPALVAAGVNAGGNSGGQHRVLMLVSKCVYSLMNGIPFGEKEAYMAPMNAFLSPQNRALVQNFMRELVDEETMSRMPVNVMPRSKSAGGRLYNIITSVGIIKQALLASLPDLWKLAIEKPQLQKKLQGLLSVALCDIPSEPC